MSFDGFPHNVRQTPVPDPLFNFLLEEIEDAAELKVTLRAIWLLGQKRGIFRTLAAAELLNDPTLRKAVKSLGGDPSEGVRRGLEQAVTRRTLLCYRSDDKASSAPTSAPTPNSARNSAAPEAPFYLLNTEANRRELARRQTGKEPLPREERWAAYSEPGSAEPPADTRPNIFALYEDNIGALGVIIGEELKEAEERYPAQWISDAFRIAVRENKRSWSYISAVLRRWASEGRGGFREAPKEPRIEPGVGQKAGAPLWEMDEVENGEPGRYTPAHNRPRYPEQRQRR